MRDGRTRKMDKTGAADALDPDKAAERFLEEHRVVLVVLRGKSTGTEHELSARRVLIGRSESADLRLEHASVSHEHALIDLGAEGFAIRDLGSTNGMSVNGSSVAGAELEHADRLQIGDFELQLVIESKPNAAAAPVWELPGVDG